MSADIQRRARHGGRRTEVSGELVLDELRSEELGDAEDLWTGNTWIHRICQRGTAR